MARRRSVLSVVTIALVALALVAVLPLPADACDDGCSCEYGQTTDYGCWVQYAVNCVVVDCPRGPGGAQDPYPVPTYQYPPWP